MKAKLRSMKARKKSVGNNEKTTKLRGGITGKGFLPGQSGNPSGRPKGSISKYYKLVLERIDPKTGKERALKVAEAHIDACEKNPSFANIVLDRTEGSVIQQHQVSGLENLAQEIAEARKRAATKEKT